MGLSENWTGDVGEIHTAKDFAYQAKELGLLFLWVCGTPTNSEGMCFQKVFLT